MKYSTLIYGPSKIGKSTFASQANKVIFLATEPGLNALSTYQIKIESWNDMLKACALLAKEKHEFETIVIDTIDIAYDLCLEHVCRGLKGKDGRPVTHPSDLGYGKGWQAVNSEFKRVLTRLAMLPFGLILISHSKVQEIETRTGKFDKIVPTCGNAKMVLAMADMVLFADMDVVKSKHNLSHKRVLRTKPTVTYDAGDRTGRLPETIPLDYQSFVEAFTHATK